MFLILDLKKNIQFRSSNIIGAIDSARAFVNLWNRFPNSRDRLINIANEISAMMENSYFGRREIHEVYEIIMNRLLEVYDDQISAIMENSYFEYDNPIHKLIINRLLGVYDDLQTQSENSAKAVEVVSQHEMNHLLEILYMGGSRQALESEGYRDIYISGIDNVNSGLRLARSLREKLADESINPRTLHIPEFADLIDNHIAFIERGISNLKKFRILKKLRNFNY